MMPLFATLCLWLGCLGVVGLPALLLCRPAHGGTLMLAPVAGLAVIATLSTMLYHAGWRGPPQLAIFLAGSVILTAGLLARRRAWPAGALPALAAVTAAWAAVMALVVAGLAIGGPVYGIFQGNHYDQLNYVRGALIFAREDYRNVVEAVNTALSGRMDPVLEAQPALNLAYMMYDQRPAVSMVLAVLWGASPWLEPMAAGVLFNGLLVSMTVFALAFAMTRLWRVPIAVAAVLGGLFAAGFHGQYLFDLDAWSMASVAGLAVMLFGGLIGLGRDTPGCGAAANAPPRERAGIGLVFVATAGILHLYPEGGSMTGTMFAGLLLWLVVSGRLARNRLPGVLAAVALAASTLVLDVDGPARFLVTQLTAVGSSGHEWASLTWGRYFFGCLFGRDWPDEIARAVGDPWSWPVLAANTLLGLGGLYHQGALLADGLPDKLRAGALALGLAGLAIGGQAHRGLRRGLAPVAAMLITTVVVAALLLLSHRYYEAGKLWTLATPFAWLGLVAPLAWVWHPGTRRDRPGLALVAAALAYAGITAETAWFRLDRLEANRGTGQLFGRSYPWTQFDRRLWTRPVIGLADRLGRCRGILLDVPDGFVRAEAMQTLYWLRLPYLLRQPVPTYYSDDVILGWQSQRFPLDCRLRVALADEAGAYVPGAPFETPLTLVAFDNGYVPGTPLPLSVDTYLRHGWGVPGPDGVAMAEPEAGLQFWLATIPDQPLILEALVAGTGTLSVSVNQHPIGSWQLPGSRPEIRRLTLPRGVLAAGQGVHLVFHADQAPVAAMFHAVRLDGS